MDFKLASWVICGAVISACSSAGGTRDEDLGGLVYAEREDPATIDVDAAAREPGELLRAASLGHRHVGALLGAHRFHASARIVVTEAGEAVEELEESARIALDADGNFDAALENSREYGRHALFVDGVLYLRPRFGKYHRRAPESPDEPLRVRDEIYGILGAHLELVGAKLEVSDRGGREVGGRSARVVALAAASVAPPRPPERLAQRAWRAGAAVREVSGEVVLDRETGVPLAASIEGLIGFTRDGQSFDLRIAVTHGIEAIGAVSPVAAPAPSETTALPERSRELEEREHLLRGLAAPLEAPQPPEADRRPTP